MARLYVRGTPVERVAARSIVEDRGYVTPCRIFTGSLKIGYGQIMLPNHRPRGAHVVVWEAANGPVPTGHEGLP